MHDPFPNEPNHTNFSLPETHEDEVYKFHRYHSYSSPLLRYLPSRALLFKIMRACIGIQNLEDIWYLKLEKKINVSTNAALKR